MKCSRCQREIRSTFSYTIVITSLAETFLANLCGPCWMELVPNDSTHQLILQSARYETLATRAADAAGVSRPG